MTNANDEIQSKLEQICHTVLEVDSLVIAIEKVVAYDSEYSKHGIDLNVYAQLADSTKKKTWQAYAQLTALVCSISGQDDLLDSFKKRLAQDWHSD